MATTGEIRTYVTIDAADAEWANQWTWRLLGGRYAARYEGPLTIYLHRELLGLVPGDGLEGDHINRNRLDCRRENLRRVTHAGNMQNTPSRKGSTSSYRGVYRDRQRGKWVAMISRDGKPRFLGRFLSEEDAAKTALSARQSEFRYAID